MCETIADNANTVITTPKLLNEVPELHKQKMPNVPCHSLKFGIRQCASRSITHTKNIPREQKTTKDSSVVALQLCETLMFF